MKEKEAGEGGRDGREREWERPTAARQRRECGSLRNLFYMLPCLIHSCVFIFFFFSSRRRHTRYWRDWSSDVCSSDLEGHLFHGGYWRDAAQWPLPETRFTPFYLQPGGGLRSEERRVGKECRYRGAAEHERKRSR